MVDLTPHLLHDLRERADRLDALAADLRRLARGEGPTPEEMAAAPLLDGWDHAYRPVPILAGDVSGHPVVGRSWARTSPLVWFDPDARIARTESRWYRLGEPLGEALAEILGPGARTETRQ